MPSRWPIDSTAAALAVLCACTGAPREPGPVARVPPMAGEPRPVAFQAAAVRDGPLALARLGDELLLVTFDESFRVDEQGRLAATDLTRPDAAETYIAPFQFWPQGGYWLHNYELAGRWPDGVWALFQGAGYGRVRVPRAVLQRKGSEWIRHDTFEGEVEWNYDAIFEWRDGQVLGLRVDGTRLAARGEGAHPVLAARDKPPGARFDVLGDRIAPAWPQIDPALIVVTAAAAPNGALMLVGYKGDVQDSHVFVQRWEPSGGPPTGVVDELPGKSAIHRLVVGAGDLAYLAGAREDAGAEAAYLAEFDGVTWSQGPVPEGRRIRDLALTPGGDLWAVVELESGSALHRRPAGRAWERVTLSVVDLPVGERWKYDRDWQPERVQRVAADAPPPVRPIRVEARGDDDVWVIAEVDDRDVLLRSAALPGPPRVIAGHARRSAEREDAGPVVPWEPGAVCSRGEGPLVPLWTIPEGTAEDAAVPVVEAFANFAAPLRPHVRGIYEFDVKGGRVAGVFVDPAIPASKLKQLRAALRRAAPDEPHEFVCRRPPILRAFDPVTGEPAP
jgi:hypothetical protein